jgi:hypothetical protein
MKEIFFILLLSAFILYLLEEHLEVRAIAIAGQPAKAALHCTHGFLTDPERQQRTKN